MHPYREMLVALSLGLLASWPVHAQAPKVEDPTPSTAIDILLDPDATMLKQATIANERLQKVSPQGFALDESHQPHITCLQRFVKTADLDKVYEAIGKVLADEKPATWKLKAHKYYFIPFNDLGLAGIVVEPTDDLIRFQKKLIDAVEPFTVKSGTKAAFVTTKEDPEINRPTIDYVKSFVPAASGVKFNPHVTIGLASQDYLTQMLGEKFEAFTFSPAGVSVCQLGNLGTAQRKLKSWDTTLVKADPLPSWKEGTAKQAILDFVGKTTTAGSPDFVAPADRIAVFDNDGTLWPENPMPFEVAFALDTARDRMTKKPELKNSPAYQALASDDIAALTDNHLEKLLQLVLDTHAGQTTEEFDKSAAEWIATAKHPRFERLYSECTYQPMQEVLKLLRANGYKTYIVSGGSQDFMRVWAENVYDVPPEHVIGTVFKTKYELKDDKPTLTILPEIALNDDKAGKPVAIHHVIGKTPVMCFGNSDGDHQMLQYTTIGRTPSFGLIVHHTDAEREYAYDAHPKSSGKLVEALKAAPERAWIVVDMKRDWKKVFAAEK